MRLIVAQVQGGWMLTDDESGQVGIYDTADEALAEIHKRMLAASSSNEQTTGQ